MTTAADALPKMITFCFDHASQTVNPADKDRVRFNEMLMMIGYKVLADNDRRASQFSALLNYIGKWADTYSDKLDSVYITFRENKIVLLVVRSDVVYNEDTAKAVWQAYQYAMKNFSLLNFDTFVVPRGEDISHYTNPDFIIKYIGWGDSQCRKKRSA